MKNIRYRIFPEEAYPFCAFILPCLHQLPEYRTTAKEILVRELTRAVDAAAIKLYIDQHKLIKNFRELVPPSGWLKMMTS